MPSAAFPERILAELAHAVAHAARWSAGLPADLAAGLFDPAERLSLYHLPGTLLLAAVVLWGKIPLSALLRRAAAVALHPSSRLDAKLALANFAASSALAGATGLSSVGVAVEVVRTLDVLLGPPAPPPVPPALAVLVYTVVLFVAWDASRFLLHLALHRVPFLWPIHAVHHSAEVLTPLSLHRIHPVEKLLYAVRDVLVTGVVSGVFFHFLREAVPAVTILGVHAAGFLLNAAGANLRHSHVHVGFGPLERWLLSPAQHQLHHARRAGAAAPNLGTWLACWDRWAGTFAASRPGPAPAFGLPPAEAGHHPHRLGSALAAPVVRAAVAGAGLLRRLLPVGVLFLAWSLAGPARAASPRTYDGPQAPAPSPDTAPAASPAHAPFPPAASPHGGTPARGPRAPEASRRRGGTEPPNHGRRPDSSPEADTERPARRVIVLGALDRRGRTVGSAHVVTERELERHEYDDVHRVLGGVPGVYVRGEDGFGLRPNIGMRGANPDRSAKVTLMEDGILLAPAPYAAPAAYFFPMTTRMTAVEVTKGPASIAHGPNTVGGAVNLRSRPIPEGPLAVVDAAGGRFGYGKVHAYAGTRARGFGVLGEFVRIQSNGFKRLDGGGPTGFGRNEGLVKLGYRTEDARGTTHDLVLKGALSTALDHETYLGLSDADFRADPYRRYAASARDRFTFFRTLVELGYGLATRHGLSFSARLYRHDFRRRWVKFDRFRDGPDPSRVLAAPDAGQNQVFAAILRGEEDTAQAAQALLLGDNDRTYFAQGISLAASWATRRRVVAQTLTFGARLHQDGVERNETDEAFWMTSGVLVPEGTPEQVKNRNRARALAGAFHVYDVVTLWDRWTVAPGLRVELIDTRYLDLLSGDRSDRLDAVVLPGLGTHVAATKWLGLFAGVHRGFSSVAPGQPRSVRPEDSINYEAGLRVTHPLLRAEATGFFSHYRNLNAVCTLSAGCTDPGQVGGQFSAGRAFVAGVESELAAEHRFRRGLRLWGRAAYTYTWARFARSFVSGFPQWGTVEAGDALPYVPAHTVAASTGVGGRVWDLSAAVRFQSEMRDVAGKGPIPESERVAPFAVLDLAAEVRPVDRLRFYGLLQNATAAKYMVSRRPMGARPGAPLTFILGIKARVLP